MQFQSKSQQIFFLETEIMILEFIFKYKGVRVSKKIKTEKEQS